jgi:hypothetical protein
LLSQPEIRWTGIAFLIWLPIAAVLLITSAWAEPQTAVNATIGASVKTTEAGDSDSLQNSVRTGSEITEEHFSNSVRSEPTFTSEASPSEQAATEAPSGQEEQQTLADAVHATLSWGIQESAAWMDSFFGDRRYESELNASYVRFRYDVFKEEGSDVSIPRPDLRIRIVLPQLQRKTGIYFSGSRKEIMNFSAIGFVSGDPEEREEDHRINAGIQQTLLDTLKDNLSIRVGVRLHDTKPLLVFGPRYRMLFPLDFWQLRFIEELNWTNQEGWESATTFDAERRLAQRLFFRASNIWTWTEGTDGLLYDVSFGIRQPVNDIRALGYEWVNLFHTRPVHELYETAIRVRYRQQLWRRQWVFFEIAPQYRFPRSNSFHGLAGILFRLEMIFGKYR